MYKFIFSALALVISSVAANAQSTNVRLYCAYDYMRHCSAFRIGSRDLEKCMADIGVNLSKKCVQALLDDGLITKEMVIERAKAEGITVVDTPEGLKVAEPGTVITPEVTPAPTPVVEETMTPEPTTPAEIEVAEAPKETVPVIKEKPAPVIMHETRGENEVERTYYRTKRSIEKTYKAVSKDIRKTFRSTKKSVSKLIKTAKKFDKEVSKKTYIKEMYDRFDNGGRTGPYGNAGLEGTGAKFGRIPPKPASYVRPKIRDWKSLMHERFTSGHLDSEGLDSFYHRNYKTR